MNKKNNRIKTSIVIILFIVLCPVAGNCAYMNFLPMEDSMSSARNTATTTPKSLQPYRQSFQIKASPKDHSYFNFSTFDICTFVFLAGAYAFLIRGRSGSRKVNL